MLKRLIFTLTVVIAIIAALAFVKYRQVTAAIAQYAAFQPPPEAVTTVEAREEPWPARLSAIGTVAAVRGVTVGADLPGVVDRIAFEAGHSVREGDILAQLDTRQERAQLAAAEAQWDLARLNFARMQDLIDQGVISKAEYDQSTAEQRQTEARVGEIRAVIDRKTIRAPFSGVLGLRQINLGQYLSGGDPIVSLQSLDPIYVNFGVPQQEAGQIKTGREVRIRLDDDSTLTAGARTPRTVQFTGRVTALDSVMDPGTRNVQVQATLANPTATLHPGMFVQAEVVLGAARSLITLPSSAINYAPYGDSVFVVDDLKDARGQSYRGVRQQVVKLGETRGDQIAVLSGIKRGEEIVTSGVFKLRNGAAVLVNNKVRPGNNPAPKPENS